MNADQIIADVESRFGQSVDACDDASHAATRSDAAAWASLPLVGRQIIPADATGPAEQLEFRNCGCGSTLAISEEVK